VVYTLATYLSVAVKHKVINHLAKQHRRQYSTPNRPSHCQLLPTALPIGYMKKNCDNCQRNPSASSPKNAVLFLMPGAKKTLNLLALLVPKGEFLIRM